MLLNQKNINYKNKRDEGLDLLKIFATIAVVKLHSGYLGQNPPLGFVSEIIHYICGFAVPIFFMVSGALVLNRKEISWKYILNKILKLLYLMLCWSILIALVGTILTRSLENPLKIFIKSLLQQGRLWHFWY